MNNRSEINSKIDSETVINKVHSILAAYFAALNLLSENWDPWLLNAEAEYHEEMRSSEVCRLVPRKLSS